MPFCDNQNIQANSAHCIFHFSFLWQLTSRLLHNYLNISQSDSKEFSLMVLCIFLICFISQLALVIIQDFVLI